VLEGATVTLGRGHLGELLVARRIWNSLCLSVCLATLITQPMTSVIAALGLEVYKHAALILGRPPSLILAMPTDLPPPYTGENTNVVPDGPYKRALEELQRRIAARNGAQRRGDEREVERLDGLILVTMSAASAAAPDAVMRNTWAERERVYARVDPRARSGILKDIGFGLMVILGAPIALAGGAVFAAGAIVYGAGKLIVSIGRALTFKAFD
jgi:hypothetical protein